MSTVTQRCLVAVLVACCGAVRAGEKPAVVLSADEEGRAVVEVHRLDSATIPELRKLEANALGWRTVFSVRVGQDPKSPAVAGSYRLIGNRLRFTPKYPLQPGLLYSAAYDPGGPDSAVRKTVTVPSKALPETTVVQQVYPTADRLPENHLRFYLVFSSPMSYGEAFERIRLMDAEGKTVDQPFLELAEEMWDPERRRLTLLIHPGRIKRGLRSREEAGPALVAGNTYTLLVDREWRDGRGARLKQGFRREFTVEAANGRPLQTETWGFSFPKPGTRDALDVRFPKPLDWALLRRMLWVAGPDGETLEGDVRVDEKETHWRFIPASAWPAGESSLTIDAALEDPCGNRIGRAFDVDRFERVDAEIKTETIRLPIRPRPAQP